ncbi:AAA family ATPase [Natronosalvus halobius]|uniref:AAA family ATPase n=1 Tax=Natronosalvus halobius TaxID=2953746 RepID=UPI00209E457B|nr:AAA family ATPase [Natronosalvus halobius]USZ71254.1 AAA family ATPase [Natronosalvus halobius]
MSEATEPEWLDKAVPAYRNRHQHGTNKDLTELVIDHYVETEEAIEPTDDGDVVLNLSEVDNSNVRSELVIDHPLITLSALSAWARHHDDYANNAVATVCGDSEDARDLRSLRQSDTNNLVKVRARVMDTTDVKTNRIVATFECQQGHAVAKHQSRASPNLKKPPSCPHTEASDDDRCGAPIMGLIRGRETVLRDSQQVILAEPNEDDRNSRKIVGEVDTPLIDIVNRDDVVTVWAIPTIPDVETQKTELYLHIVGMTHVESDEIEVTKEDIEELERISKEADNAPETVAQSIAPEIVNRGGHNSARLALACSLVGGNDSRLHTLLMGEPGSAKSEMIRAARKVVNGYYVDMSQTTKAGLTGAVSYNGLIQDEDTVLLEAGAIPRAHQSVLAVDELDKSHIESQTALNTPMEHGEVHITKHGKGVLEADTTLVAACNPEKEVFDSSIAPIAQQPLKDSVFSRFDLCVVVNDSVEDTVAKERAELEEIMVRRRGEFRDEILDNETLRKFIAHAQTLEPELSGAAEDYVLDKLAELRVRVSRVSPDGMQVSGRVRETLIGLSEAMAKLRLGETVTAHDAERAYALMAECWQGLAMEDLGLETAEEAAVAHSLASSSIQQQVVHQAIATLRLHEGREFDVNIMYDAIDAEGSVVDWVLETFADRGHIHRDDEIIDVIDLPA